MKNYIRKQKWLRRPPVLTQERDTQRGKTSGFQSATLIHVTSYVPHGIFKWFCQSLAKHLHSLPFQANPDDERWCNLLSKVCVDMI
jgi:hypothetical protein